MKITIINPNSSANMTETMLSACMKTVSQDVDLKAIHTAKTPSSIQGHSDAIYCLPSVLSLIESESKNGTDGFVIACADDPGIDACRELTNAPIIGISQAAMMAAATISPSFSIITTLPRSIHIIQELVIKYGYTHQCKRVRAVNLPVLALEDEKKTVALLSEEIVRAKDEDGCESIILGCAGMSGLQTTLSEQLNIPVIDGVSVAVNWIASLVRTGLKTSKVCSYASPLSIKE